MSLPERSQLNTAITEAKLKGRSGLYFIKPRWAGKRNLIKFGISAQVHRRMWSSYKTCIPVAAGSFALLAFMVVPETLMRQVESRVKALTNNQNGFIKPPFDVEWREIPAHKDVLNTLRNIMILARNKRTTLGKMRVFHPETGKILWEGGKDAEHDPDNDIVFTGRPSRSNPHVRAVTRNHKEAAEGGRLGFGKLDLRTQPRKRYA